MRLSQLEYFIKIAQCGSITKAAQELFLSQPSLTKSINNLEAEYNLQLLERTAKGIRVTPQGQEFLEYAKAAVDACKRLEHTFGRQKQQPIQRLRIASQQFDFLYPVLEQLYAMHCTAPIHIDLEEADRGTILERVEKRESDMGRWCCPKATAKILNRTYKNGRLMFTRWIPLPYTSVWEKNRRSISKPTSTQPKQPASPM